MSLRDIFDNEKHPRLGSVTDELVDEFNQNENSRDNNGDGSGEFDRNDLGNGGDTQAITRDEKFLNRMIQIKGIPKAVEGDKGPGYLLDPDFAEQYILNSIDKTEQRHLWRRLVDIIHLGQGDGNSELVRSKVMSFTFRVLSHRSRNDTATETTERILWSENRSTQKQTMRTQQGGGSSQSNGLLARIFGK
jgi:hypothetical protein